MARDPDRGRRREQILDAAQALFAEHEVSTVPLDRVVEQAGIAKGTFYLYFSSKQDLLAGLAQRTVDRMADRALDVVESSDGTATETLIRALAVLKQIAVETQHTVDSLERPENLELRERINVEFVRTIGPIVAQAVERGCETGEFDVADPVATVQAILASETFLLDNPLFGWDDHERIARIKAVLVLTERALGARPQSLVGPLSELFGAHE